MKTTRIILTLTLLFSLTGCSHSEDEKEFSVTGIPIQISDVEETSVNYQLILQQVEELVDKYLPESQYRDVVYKANCIDILDGNGELIFDFIQVENRGLLDLNPKVFDAKAIVNIESHYVDLEISDVTDYYPNLDVYPEITSEDFEKLLSAVAKYFEKQSYGNCILTITQLQDSWNVLCNYQNEQSKRCEFSVDPTTFEIIDYKPPR